MGTHTNSDEATSDFLSAIEEEHKGDWLATL